MQGQSNKLVAVVTPVYNGQAYLAETMACVQQQTYAPLVHVVLDNASTDTTADIISQYKNGRVPILAFRNEQTIPPTDNFNRALGYMPPQVAYFRILCADDAMTPDAIARMVEIIERDDRIAAVTCKEGAGSALDGHEWPPGEIFEGKDIIAATFLDKAPTAASHCLYRRECYDARAPNFFDKTLPYGDDVDVLFSVMTNHKVGYVREPIAFTRRHPGAISASVHHRKRLHLAEWLIFLHRYGKAGLGESAEALTRTFRRYYLRKLLRWALMDLKAPIVREHADMLAGAGVAPRLVDFIDAVLDWPLVKFGVRPRWTFFPT
ncbi:MAG: glycosyltransferase family 2 protein [Hyphomonadaceae bacterium]|nr:glycosyltransferase family 2 protein [Hyphomonadaceae bacterium]